MADYCQYANTLCSSLSSHLAPTARPACHDGVMGGEWRVDGDDGEARLLGGRGRGPATHLYEDLHGVVVCVCVLDVR
jgi:hypothetical protein